MFSGTNIYQWVLTCYTHHLLNYYICIFMHILYTFILWNFAHSLENMLHIRAQKTYSSSFQNRTILHIFKVFVHNFFYSISVILLFIFNVSGTKANPLYICLILMNSISHTSTVRLNFLMTRTFHNFQEEHVTCCVMGAIKCCSSTSF